MPSSTVGFAAVVCNRCGSAEFVLDELRTAVRRAPHGMLISSGCLLDQLRCVGRTDGVMVLVQPCAIDRTPTGPAVMFGPIGDAESAVLLRDWLDEGHWAAPLPAPVARHRQQR
ncbi:hypothetical protein ACRCUN_31100 [Mycobacterium sp. LTG2003]